MTKCIKTLVLIKWLLLTAYKASALSSPSYILLTTGSNMLSGSAQALQHSEQKARESSQQILFMLKTRAPYQLC